VELRKQIHKEATAIIRLMALKGAHSTKMTHLTSITTRNCAYLRTRYP